MRTGREEPIDHRILSVFALVGGGAGMLAAFLGWDRRVNKNNVAWRFMAIIGVIMWALITFCVYGTIELDIVSLINPLGFSGLVPLGIYLITMNLVSFAVFVYDKLRAEQGRMHNRLSELVLLRLSLARGAVGGIAEMHLVCHKARKWYSAWGLPSLILLQAAMFLYGSVRPPLTRPSTP